MKIYLTRHGETEWNAENRVQGQLNSNLTKSGIEMGKKLAGDAKDIVFDKVYSSDLGRAFDTAKLIVPTQEIITTPLLREIDTGSWSGKIFSDIKEVDGENYRVYFKDPVNFNRGTGETFYDLVNRVNKFFEEYIYNSDDENVLIVSHGVTIIAIFNLIEKVELKDFWSNKVQRNSEFNIIEYSNGKFNVIKKAPMAERVRI